MQSELRAGIVLDDDWIKLEVSEMELKTDPEAALSETTTAAIKQPEIRAQLPELHDQKPNPSSELSGCLSCSLGQELRAGIVLDDDWIKFEVSEMELKTDPEAALSETTTAAIKQPEIGAQLPELHDQKPNPSSELSGCLSCSLGQLTFQPNFLTCTHQIIRCSNGRHEASGKGLCVLSKTGLARSTKHSLMEELMEDYVRMSEHLRSVFCKRAPDLCRSLVCPACGYFIESRTDRLLLLVKHIRFHHPKICDDLLEYCFQQYSRLFDFCLGALLKDRDIIDRHFFCYGMI